MATVRRLRDQAKAWIDEASHVEKLKKGHIKNNAKLRRENRLYEFVNGNLERRIQSVQDDLRHEIDTRTAIENRLQNPSDQNLRADIQEILVQFGHMNIHGAAAPAVAPPPAPPGPVPADDGGDADQAMEEDDAAGGD